MFCWDKNSCDMRHQSKNWWTSSKVWQPQMAQGGIFSNVASESPFYNANLIWVKCAPTIPRGRRTPRRALKDDPAGEALESSAD